MSASQLVYLDHSVFVNLADRKLSKDREQALRHAISATKSVVVVSVAHLIDVARDKDASRRDRVLHAMASFPLVLITLRSPAHDEQEILDSVFEGRPCGKVPRLDGTLISGEGAAYQQLRADVPLCETLARVGEYEASADNYAKRAKRLSGPTRATTVLQQKYLADLLTAEGRDRLTEELRALPGLVFSTAPRPALEKLLKAAGERLERELVQSGGSAEAYIENSNKHPGTSVIPTKWRARKGGIDKWLTAAQALAPGLHAVVRRDMESARNSFRESLPSDLSDAQHLRFIPYMHVATVDAFTFRALRGQLAPVLGESVRLTKNGDFEGLLENIHAGSERPAYVVISDYTTPVRKRHD